MIYRHSLASLLACAMLNLVVPAHASTIIYDTFLPHDHWSGGGFGISPGPGVEIGVSFTPFSTGYLSEIWIAVSAGVTNAGADLDVILRANNNGFPGEILLLIPVIDELVYNQTTPLVLQLPGNLLLSSHEQYWLTLASHPDNWAIWHNMSLGFDELPPYLGTGIARAPHVLNGEWFITGNNDNVFRIYADSIAVPTPGSLLLLLLGLVALAIVQRCMGPSRLVG
jgi:hypothetical protein